MRHRFMRWGWLDSLLLVLLVLLALYVSYRIFYGLEYRWSWQVLAQYLLRHDPQQGWVPNILVQGLLTTIRLSFWSLLLALPFGIVAGLLRTSPHVFNRLFGGTYVTLLRNLPPLVLVFIFFFFISDQILPLLQISQRIHAAPDWLQTLVPIVLAPTAHIETFIAAVLTLALLEGAYVAEIVRAGINSIESGQWEAARALGMRRWQLMRTVVLPQAMQRMVPPLAGQAISTIKDSAIVSVISVQELTFQGMELMASTYLTFEIWMTVTALYFVLTYSCSFAAARLELRMRRAYVY